MEVLDGDDVRQNLCAGLGFSREDRDVNVRRIAWVADLLSRNGVVTFVAAVSPYRQTRDEARARMGDRFVEVHVRASVDECERRDVKGLYERARAGKIQGFTGVSDPYEEPLDPELTLETESESPEESAARLVEYVEAPACGLRGARHCGNELGPGGAGAGGALRGRDVASGAPSIAVARRGGGPWPAAAAIASARAWAGVRRSAPISGSADSTRIAAWRNAQAKPSRAEPAVSRTISSSKPGSGSKRSSVPPV